MAIKQVKNGFVIDGLPQVYDTHEEASAQLNTYKNNYNTHIVDKVLEHKKNKLKTVDNK